MLPIADIELAVSVDLMLAGDPDLASRFQVAVANGVVTLEGDAASREQRDAALATAHSVPGVKVVVSRIRIVA